MTEQDPEPDGELAVDAVPVDERDAAETEAAAEGAEGAEQEAAGELHRYFLQARGGHANSVGLALLPSAAGRTM